MTTGIEISPNPPVAGSTATVTVPARGEWHAYVRDSITGELTDLGPLAAGPDSTFEITIPAGAAGDVLTITDEAAKPTEQDFNIVSTN